MQTDIAQNLAQVKSTIARVADKHGRDPAGVGLVAVTKTHPPETVRAAIAAEHRVFGENRVQEAEAKWPAIKAEYPNCRLHLIGPLQRNKVANAVRLFDVIETIHRRKLAAALARHMEASGRRPDCLIQVNTGEEPQKAGVFPGEADAFIAACRDEFGLPVLGLMCIPPLEEEPAMHFALLAEIARRNGLEQLSMGMSADFETAVQFGATLVRVGTTIFGARQDYDRQRSVEIGAVKT
ncbi:MAG: YggS family pyridoxal phosphate-dependent enzyme [Pseudomonadota bacterium]|nr:YggS family pyridoxal phosphate-dependent enzyme [Pseudomonadota bacterium]